MTLGNQIVFAQIGTLNVVTAIFAASTAATNFLLRGRRVAFAVASALLYLTHQPAILFAGAFALHTLALSVRQRRGRGVLRDFIPILVSLIPIGIWNAYITLENGWFLNPDWMQAGKTSGGR
jgi:hypothetical protein